MSEINQASILELAAQAHSWTASTYRKHPAIKDSPDWLEKQRVLLADMSLHLLKTALDQGEIDRHELHKNLYAILTICDQFLPQHQLKVMADKLYHNSAE